MPPLALPSSRSFAAPRLTPALIGLLTLGLVLLGTGPAHADPTQPHELDNPLVWANQCEYCHSYNNDPAVGSEPYYAPWFTWRGSMMANAARDPVFWAAVALASQDAAEPSETEACIRCHAPRAFLEGRGDAIAQDELYLEDLAGVECELCHRMVDDGALGNGQYAIDDVLVGETLRGRVFTSRPLATDDGFRMTLRCIERKGESFDETKRRTREAILWEGTQTVRSADSSAGVPVEILVPPAAIANAKFDRQDWSLIVEATVGGANGHCRCGTVPRDRPPPRYRPPQLVAGSSSGEEAGRL